MRLSRRELVTTSAAAAVLAGLPARWPGGVYASDAPEHPKVRVGIIALTDCSSIVMAHELGLFKKHGIESTISKEASWAVIRDRLTLGENQATHMLLGTPYAATMGLQGSPVKPMIIPCYLNRNGQAITLTKALLDRGARTPAQIKPLALEAKAKGSPMAFAMTYPPGTHAMWMHYWLAAAGINPLSGAKLITVPPPQMVANMRVGNMDGFCVGEPWNHRAIMDGIGITANTTQDLWKDHPEKVLGTSAEFVKKNPNTTRAVMMAVLEASQWIDASLSNKMKMAETVAGKAYVNTSVDAINQRILGRYQNGLGKTWDDPNHMKFFNDGAVNFPYLSDGMWFLTQHKRWGLLKEHPDYLAVAKQINQIDLYKQAASALKINVPKDVLRTSKLIDGVVWDGKDPKKYADGFAIKA